MAGIHHAFIGAIGGVNIVNRIAMYGTNSPVPSTVGPTRQSYYTIGSAARSDGSYVLANIRGLSSYQTYYCGDSGGCVPDPKFTPNAGNFMTFDAGGALLSETNYTWVGTVGAAGWDYYNDSDKLGNLWVLTRNPATDWSAFGVVKFNNNGTIGYSKRVTNNNTAANERLNAVAPNPTNGEAFLYGYREYAVAKLDSAGALSWSYLYNYGTWGIAGLYPARDGGFFIYNQNNGGTAFRIDKFDTNGLFVSGRTINLTTTTGAWGHGIGEDSSGNIYLVNTQYGSVAGFFIKFDSSWNVVWQKRFTFPNFTFNGNAPISIRNLEVEDDGTIYMLMSNENQSLIGTVKILSKWNTNGDVVWARQLSGTIAVNDFCLAGPDNLLLTGPSYQSYQVTNDYPFYQQAFLCVLPKNGNFILSQSVNNGTNSLTKTVINTTPTVSAGSLTFSATSTPSRSSFSRTVSDFSLVSAASSNPVKVGEILI